MASSTLIRENVPLAPHTYYKIGGPARFFAEPESIDDLKSLAGFIHKNKPRYFILGAGSNVLFDDRGFNGLVIHTNKIDRTLLRDGTTITVGASVMVIQLLRLCMNDGIAGFELLVGIPGNMGGVLTMNAGTKLGEIKDVVTEIKAFDLETQTTRLITNPELHYSYRHNHFLKPSEIVLCGKLCGKPSDPKAVQDQIQSLLTARKKSQPIDKPSCGSVFKNPDPQNGVHAWKVIADVGLRGHRIGNAQISELHTNFIVNLGGAHSIDVQGLIAEAKTRARAQLGIELEEEVKIIRYDEDE